MKARLQKASVSIITFKDYKAYHHTTRKPIITLVWDWEVGQPSQPHNQIKNHFIYIFNSLAYGTTRFWAGVVWGEWENERDWAIKAVTLTFRLGVGLLKQRKRLDMSVIEKPKKAQKWKREISEVLPFRSGFLCFARQKRVFYWGLLNIMNTLS